MFERSRSVLPVARWSVAAVVLLALLGALLHPVWAEPDEAVTHWYASPTGSGTACTKPAPCKLADAQSKVRLATATMSGDLVVNLASGRYELDSPLNLSAASGDSGTGGHRVVYQAEGFGTGTVANPVLSGGKAVTGWTQVTGKQYYQASVGSLDTRQLYVNDKRAFRAAGPAKLPGTLTRTANGYTSTDTSMQSWQNASQIELRFADGDADGWLWAEPRCRIASITGTATRTTVNVVKPCFDLMVSGRNNPEPPTGIENSLTFLDQPGEFVLDTGVANHVLYYYPRAGENLATAQVIAPVLQSVVTSPATSTQPITNVTFAGITFAETTWLQPGTTVGFVETSYNKYAQPSGPELQIQAGVWLRAARGVVLERDKFVRMGGAGLTLDNGSQGNTVRGNVFTDLSGNGVQIGNVDLNASTGPNAVADNLVSNNYLHQLGREFPGANGIWNANTVRTTITHNELTNLPRGGIASNYTYMGTDGFLPTGHVFSYNKVWNYLNVMRDGGGFDTNGLQNGRSGSEPGSKLIGNVFYDANNNYGQIYFDLWTAGFLAQNNLAWDSVSNDYNTISGFNNQACCNDHRYNFYDQNNDEKHLSYTDMVVGEGKELPATAMPASIIANAGLQPAYRDLNPRTPPADTSAPTAPGQPQRQSLDPGPGATIGWAAATDNVGVTGYEVSDGTTVLAAVPGGVTSAELVGLRPSTTYTFTVRARDAAGNLSPASASLNVRTNGAGDSKLVGHWPLDESGDDVSGSDNDAGVESPMWRDGAVGRAMRFDGVDSFVHVPDSDVTNFDRGDFTLTGHFAAQSDGWQRMVTKGHYGNSPGYFLQWSSGHLVFGVGGKKGDDDSEPMGAVLLETNESFADGAWHSVAAVVDRSSRTVRVYVDGTARALTATTGAGFCTAGSGTSASIDGCVFAAASSNDQLTFGAYVGEEGLTEQYEGSLDDIRLYSRVLSPAEIANL